MLEKSLIGSIIYPHPKWDRIDTWKYKNMKYAENSNVGPPEPG